jgi:very-short-patch-repair endonuclease
MREARDRGAAQALADGALRSNLVLEDVEGALRRARGWPGVRQAREAWLHVDARAESPHESRCRVWFRDAELPEPELQVVLGDELRTFRVDFLFREQRTVVEADGRLKYTDPAALWEEKVREDWLRDQGFEVVRAIWADHRDGGYELVRRIRRAFDRTARRAA